MLPRQERGRAALSGDRLEAIPPGPRRAHVQCADAARAHEAPRSAGAGVARLGGAAPSAGLNCRVLVPEGAGGGGARPGGCGPGGPSGGGAPLGVGGLVLRFVCTLPGS